MMDESLATWTKAAPAEGVPEGKAVSVRVGSQSVLLFRLGDSVFAVGNRCSHQGAMLHKGRIASSISPPTVTCPIHGSTFRLTDGAVVRGPATTPIPALEARLTGDIVEVRARLGR
jgi:nitrite reductase/ring-hydroxylating ferredoxin subunit